MDSDDDVNWRLLSTPSPPSIRAESTKAISRDSGTLPVLTPAQTLANLDDVPLLFHLDDVPLLFHLDDVPLLFQPGWCTFALPFGGAEEILRVRREGIVSLKLGIYLETKNPFFLFFSQHFKKGFIEVRLWDTEYFENFTPLSISDGPLAKGIIGWKIVLLGLPARPVLCLRLFT